MANDITTIDDATDRPASPVRGDLVHERVSGNTYHYDDAWLLAHERPLEVSNPKAFGAIGDGGSHKCQAADVAAHPEWKGVYVIDDPANGIAGDELDYIGLQEAIYDAFGAPGEEHVVSNAYLNKRLWIPAGRYRVNKTIEFQSVVGGVVTGAGRFSTVIEGRTPDMIVVRLNRVSFSVFSGLGVHHKTSNYFNEGALVHTGYWSNFGDQRSGTSAPRAAASGTQATFVDSGASWPNLAGAYLHVTAGTGAGFASRILSNSATTLVLARQPSVVFDGTSEYVITGRAQFRGSVSSHSGNTTSLPVTFAWYVTDFLYRPVTIVGGTGAGQTRWITATTYDSFTVTEPWTTAPDATSVIVVHESRHEASGTAESGGASTLTDDGKSWTSNQWAGHLVVLTGGTGAGQAREIASNTADTISVTVPWDTAPGAGTSYAIYIKTTVPRSGLGTGGARSIVAADISPAGDGSGASSDHWSSMLFQVVEGTGAGQRSRVLSNTGTELVLETPLGTALDSTSRWVIYARAAAQGATSQSNTFQDMHFSGENNGVAYGFVNAIDDSFSAAGANQGSEFLFKDCFFQWFTRAGYWQNGFNALQNRFHGGNFANCQQYAIYNQRGAFNADTVSFQNWPGSAYIAAMADMWDVRVDNAVNDVNVLSGCRTESVKFCKGVNEARILIQGLSMSFPMGKWEPSHSYSSTTGRGVGDIRTGTSANGCGRMWRCTTGGVSAGTEPNWRDREGMGGGITTQSDGGVVWTLVKYNALDGLTMLLDSVVIGGGTHSGSDATFFQSFAGNVFGRIEPLGHAERQGSNTALGPNVIRPGFDGIAARPTPIRATPAGRNDRRMARSRMHHYFGNEGFVGFQFSSPLGQFKGDDVGISRARLGPDAADAALAVWGRISRIAPYDDDSALQANRRGLDTYLCGGYSTGDASSSHDWNRTLDGRAEDGRVVIQTAEPGASGATLNPMADRLVFDRDGKALLSAAPVLVPSTAADLDATPSVKAIPYLVLSNSGATSITDFDDAAEGQELTLEFSNGNTTLVHAAGVLQLDGGASFAGSADDIVVLIHRNGVWREKSRSVN